MKVKNLKKYIVIIIFLLSISIHAQDEIQLAPVLGQDTKPEPPEVPELLADRCHYVWVPGHYTTVVIYERTPLPDPFDPRSDLGTRVSYNSSLWHDGYYKLECKIKKG